MSIFGALAIIMLAAAAAATIVHAGARRLGPDSALLLMAVMMAPGLMLWRLVENERETAAALVASPAWLGLVFLGWLSGRDKARNPKSGWFRWLAAAMVLIVVGLGGTDFYQDWRERRDRQLAYQAERAARLAQREAEARRCIADLARRSPEADAAADAARGDATPIGLSFMPHDPATWTTDYPNGCERSPVGRSYRATGKWFRYTHDGFSFEGSAPSEAQCQRAARDYAVRYNRRMTAIAPAAVARFCAALLVRPAAGAIAAE